MNTYKIEVSMRLLCLDSDQNLASVDQIQSITLPASEVQSEVNKAIYRAHHGLEAAVETALDPIIEKEKSKAMNPMSV